MRDPNRILPHVDVRGDGGQVVFVGSRNPKTGGEYTWAEGLGPDDVEMAELPVEVLAWDWKKAQAADSTPLPPPPPAGNPHAANGQAVRPASGRRANAYAQSALKAESDAVAACSEGGRNHRLNEAAFNLGQLVGAGHLDRRTVELTLTWAAGQCGLADDANCGPDGIRKTIESGIEAGMRSPRQIPDATPLPPPPPPSRPALAPPPPPATQSGGASVAVITPGDTIPLGEKDPETGQLVLSPRRTLPTAQAFVREFYAHPDGRRLHFYASVPFQWEGNRYVEIEDGALRQLLQPWLHNALRYVVDRRTGAMVLVDFESNPATINAALDSVRALTHLPKTITPAAWLTPGADGSRPDPRELLPFPSGTLHVPTRHVLAPTPALFNVNAIDFDYQPDAEPPERWTRFLEQLWGDDIESVQLLQEWMGYCLVADTSQQKALFIVGPKRSGKGTIGRVISRLVGDDNVAGPTTSTLAEQFGMQELIGKTLAIISDARFTGDEASKAMERILCVTGEDPLTISRKYLGGIRLKLPTRFMIFSNELPRFGDASGAVASRFLILRLTRSFFGQEDHGLTDALLEELPGVLLWAIEGLKRLRERGRFVQPESGRDAMREMEDLASPVMAFVRDCCTVGPNERVWADNIYEGWRQWCQREGRSAVTSRATFGRDLAAAVPSVERRKGADDRRFYEGIGLKSETP